MHSCTHAKGEIDNQSLITGFSMKSGIYLSILIEMTILCLIDSCRFFVTAIACPFENGDKTGMVGAIQTNLSFAIQLSDTNHIPQTMESIKSINFYVFSHRFFSMDEILVILVISDKSDILYTVDILTAVNGR